MDENEVIEEVVEEVSDKDSILTTVKKMLGIDKAYEHFDTDITIHINSVFMILNQMGVGPEEPFVITDANDKWSDFTNDDNKLVGLKSYMYYRVRMMFDPPTSSLVGDSIKRNLEELEWRLMNHG